jgi:eukaryotic-like serine/threonine-protein kinase
MTERDIFIAALQKEGPAERQAYLDEACSRQPELRRQVEHLLRLHEGAGNFLEIPAGEPPAAGAFPNAAERASAGEAPGAVLGPYKLLEQIGEGGMGTVWMAQQTEPVRRLVAVKLVKAGMDSRQVLARFEAERQALALMDHPNIARVLDAGTTGAGRPYFVMDLVKGVPITRYCDDHRLTPRQRLELFLPVCQAVQHAHQKGVIHRDLKPGNVLVALYDGKPVPKVIDFGVAKAAGQPLTEKTLVTGFGALVGTLEYMSPEQAEINQLDIDTRSDIYALGVLLYELLTGSPPFTRKELEKVGLLEMLRVIREREPTRPSTKLSTAEGLPTLAANRGTEPAKLTKLVRGELDWIVMKALEKDRGRRYETANGLAMDLQRYLADEPVLACPPSAGYRLRKFSRRNRSGLAVGGLVLFFLVLLGSVAGWAWRDREARAQEAELERAARAAEQANHLERAVQRAELLQREGKRGEALAALERAQLLAREFEPSPPLRKRIDTLQRLLDAEGRDLDFVARYESILREEQTEADVHENVFGTAKGNPRLREALKQYGIEVAVTPPADAVARIQASPPAVQEHVVTALDECLRSVPGDEVLRRQWYVEVLQEADSDAWRRKVRRAWLTNPQDAAARSQWADYWYEWGVWYSDHRQYAKAIRDFSKAVEVEPEKPIAWHSLALLRLHSGDRDEYRKLCAELLTRFGKKDDAESKAFVTWTCVLAPGSVPDSQAVLEVAASLATQFPESANNRLVHGAALYRSGQWKAAVERIHESQQAPVRDLGWPGQELFLAMACMRLGQVEDARRWLDTAVQWERENPGAAWWARVLTEILRREAEALIGQGGDDPGPKKHAEK